MRKNINANTVSKEDFDEAMGEIKPSLTEEMNQFYDSVMKKKKSQIMDEDITYMG